MGLSKCYVALVLNRTLRVQREVSSTGSRLDDSNSLARIILREVDCRSDCTEEHLASLRPNSKALTDAAASTNA